MLGFGVRLLEKRVRTEIKVRVRLGLKMPGYEKVRVRNIWKPSRLGHLKHFGNDGDWLIIPNFMYLGALKSKDIRDIVINHHSTALHKMQTRSYDENSVRPSVPLSVRPSVWQTRAL